LFVTHCRQMKLKATIRKLMIACAILASVCVHGQSPRPVTEQKIFSRNARIDHPVRVPPDVLKLLLSTREGKEGMSRASDAQKQNPAQLFRAAEVHLRAADEADLVIEGVPPMANGDHDWFWVVRPAGKKPRIALFAGGNSLEILDTQSNSYRDISSIWNYPKETLTTFYKFNGKKYGFRKVLSRKVR
jgi:hypothetical protein